MRKLITSALTFAVIFTAAPTLAQTTSATQPVRINEKAKEIRKEAQTKVKALRQVSKQQLRACRVTKEAARKTYLAALKTARANFNTSEKTAHQAFRASKTAAKTLKPVENATSTPGAMDAFNAAMKKARADQKTDLAKARDTRKAAYVAAQKAFDAAKKVPCPAPAPATSPTTTPSTSTSTQQ